MADFAPALQALGTIGGIIMAAAALYTALGARQKGQGDFTKSISDAASSLISPLRNELEQVRRELNAERAERERLGLRVRIVEQDNAELRAGVALLTNQVVALGQKPLYQPRDVAQQ